MNSTPSFFLPFFLTNTTDYIEIRLLPEAGSTSTGPPPLHRRFIPTSDSAAVQQALQAALEHNREHPSKILISLNPRIRPEGTDDAVAAVHNLMFDLDGDQLPIKQQQQRLQVLLDRIPPALVVRSGSRGHAHVYFHLDPPADPDEAWAVSKRLRLHLQADATEAPSWCARLPGSCNWKTSQPVPVEVVHQDPTAATTLATITAAMDAVDVPHLTEDQLHRVGGLQLPPPAGTPERAAWFRSVLPDRISREITDGVPKGQRSEADMRVVGALLDAGADDAEVHAFFASAAHGIGAKFRDKSPKDRVRYLARTISRHRMSQPNDSYVHIVRAWDDPRRMNMELEVVAGPHLGDSFRGGVSRGTAAWAPFLLSASFNPSAPLPDSPQPANRTCRVVLRDSGDHQLEVARWLAPLGWPAPAPSQAVVQGFDSTEIGRRSAAELDLVRQAGVRVDTSRWFDLYDRTRQKWTQQRDAAVDRTATVRMGGKLRHLDSYGTTVLRLAQQAPDSRVRCAWQETAAGRIEASNPALPTMDREMRSGVVPPEGHVFIDVDLAACHLRLFAGWSQDRDLLWLLGDPCRDPHVEVGRSVAPSMDADLQKKIGKLINIAGLYLIGPQELVKKVAKKGVELTQTEARACLEKMASAYPTFAAWRRSFRLVQEFRSPLGRLVTIPTERYFRNGKPWRPAFLAAMAQAAEADALHLVLAGWEKIREATGARIVLLLRDGFLVEVPLTGGDETRRRAEELALESFGWVCAPCRPAVKLSDPMTCWK